MTIRPIIFSTPMVLALLDGRKSQTRRLATSPLRKCVPGDLLYVREAFAFVGGCDPGLLITFADYPSCVPAGVENIPPADQIKWSPSIHMPRDRSRLTLEVSERRVEPLHSITEDDAKAEGVQLSVTPEGRGLLNVSAKHSPVSYSGGPRRDGESIDDCIRRAWTFRAHYAALWDDLHGTGSWGKNPDVIALTFRVYKRNVDQLAKDAA